MTGPDRTVLISTLHASWGGVPSMLGFIFRALKEEGLQPRLACYMPFRMDKALSVPLIGLFGGRRPGWRDYPGPGDVPTRGIGAWLPELEFTHYLPTAAWRDLMAAHRYHIAVSGNCLTAWHYVRTRRPFLAWVATPWHEDRKDRVRGFPWYRKVLDRSLNSHVLRRQERKVLNAGTILALSNYTRRGLEEVGGSGCVDAVMPMPVDTHTFHPDANAVVPGRIGFTGRFDDPRKNIHLLLDALCLLRKRGVAVTAELVGSKPTPEMAARLAAPELLGAVTTHAHMGHPELVTRLRAMDVFVIPSHQEGLCIAALEAMASGCPVVSTRCGGPEDFVRDRVNGALVDASPNALASAVERIVTNRSRRNAQSAAARQTVEDQYAYPAAKEVFLSAFSHTFSCQSTLDPRAALLAPRP